MKHTHQHFKLTFCNKTVSLAFFFASIFQFEINITLAIFFASIILLKLLFLTLAFFFASTVFAFFFANIPFLVYCTRLRKHQVQTDIHQHGFYTYLMAIQKQHPLNHFYTYKHVKNPNYTISIAKQSNHSYHRFTYKRHIV